MVTQPENQAEAAEIVADAEGPVLSEDASLLVATGSEEAYEPLMMKYLARSEHWDEAQLTERIRDREFAVIVTWQTVETADPHDGRWTWSQKQAIGQEYHLDRTIGQYRIYRPEEGS
jgi:hypothetical protein